VKKATRRILSIAVAAAMLAGMMVMAFTFSSTAAPDPLAITSVNVNGTAVSGSSTTVKDFQNVDIRVNYRKSR